MNLSMLLDRLFQRQNITSGTQVKQRLKFILAHDRSAIEPQVFDNMRHEIMRVVSKYVELDEGSLDIRLECDKRMTALIANLPIRMVREELPNLVDLVTLFDEPSVGRGLISEQPDSLALEMDQFAEEALDAIAAKEKLKARPKSITEKPNFDDTGIAERNT
jgi:cell division topological specificity factor